MSVTIKSGQQLRAGVYGADVYDSYTSGKKIQYSVRNMGEVVGIATGQTFESAYTVDVALDKETTDTRTSKTKWAQIKYVSEVRTFGLFPNVETKIGYVNIEELSVESLVSTDPKEPSEPIDDDPWGVGDFKGNTGGKDKPDTTPVNGEDLPGGMKVVSTERTGLPKWAVWVLGGLAAVAVGLGIYLLATPKKKKGAVK